MIIKAISKEDYINKYMLTLKGIYKFSDREFEVARELVYRYFIVREGLSSLSVKDKDKINIMELLKKPDSLKFITDNLSMNFEVFREYIKSLKEKQFFLNGDINPIFIPNEGQTQITIKWK